MPFISGWWSGRSRGARASKFFGTLKRSVSLFLFTSGAILRALKGRRVRSKSPLRIWDGDEGVAGGNGLRWGVINLPSKQFYIFKTTWPPLILYWLRPPCLQVPPPSKCRPGVNNTKSGSHKIVRLWQGMDLSGKRHTRQRIARSIPTHNSQISCVQHNPRFRGVLGVRFLT